MVILVQMLDHHAFCELEIVDFSLVPDDSGAFGRGHETFEANPGGDGTRPMGRVRGGVPPPGVLGLWNMARLAI